MNKLKQNKAITLIALIITIIVLLILAGVVINMTVGNNGIIYKSMNAAETYKIEAAREQIMQDLIEMKIDKNDLKFPDDLLETAENGGIKSYDNKITNVELKGNRVFVTYEDKYIFEIDENLNVKYMQAGANEVGLTAIALNKNNLNLNINATYLLQISEKTPLNGKLTEVTWSSSNTDVATVNGNGLVTAIAKGTAVITAKANNSNSITATCNIEVNEIITTSEVIEEMETVEGAKKYIGKTVNNYTAEGLTWQIYDITSDGNILLICKDNVNTEFKSLKEFTNTSSYSACMTYLSTTSNWENYVDSGLGGLSAVGAVSIAQYNGSAKKTGGFTGGNLSVGVNSSSAPVYNGENVYYNTTYGPRFMVNG